MTNITIYVEDEIEQKGKQDIGLTLSCYDLTIRRAMSGVSIPLDQLDELMARITSMRFEYHRLKGAVGSHEHKGP